MKKERCPFLEEITVRYCKAYPVKKMIPTNMLINENPCIGCPQKCNIYTEVANAVPQVSVKVVERAAMAKSCVCIEPNIRLEKVRGFSFHPSVHYLSNHIWLRVENNDTIKIGFDDFAVKLLSEITAIFPQPKGEALNHIMIEQEGRVRKIPVQTSGKITDFNKRLIVKPESMKKDPYLSSWLYELKSNNLSDNLNNSRKGEAARAWLEKEVDSLQQMLQAECGVTLADGGEIVADFKDKITEKIIKRFLYNE